MKTTWREALRDRRFLVSLGLACLTLLVLVPFAPYYFSEIIGPKPGMVLNDWVLNHLRPTDWSLTIFVLIYSFLAITLLLHFNNPQIMLVGLITYSGVTWLRMLSIYLFTLEAPPGMIYLADPFLFMVVYPQRNFAKDLFFSGHVSTMTVLMLIEPIQKLKRLKVVAGVAVGLLLLIQHVHYSIDVFFAPFFTYLIYRLVMQFKKPLIN